MQIDNRSTFLQADKPFCFSFNPLDETVSGSPGDLSVASQTSADVLLGSLQSTLQSLKCSWEGGSLSASEQRRTSSKMILPCQNKSVTRFALAFGTA